MTSNDTQVSQLILNLIESKEVFNTLANNGLNANQLYLVANDDSDPVTSVNYTSTGTPKLTYTTDQGNTVDIITIANLKSALSLSTVATSGQYTSLTGKPSINNVELSGNKTTSDLGITLNYETTAITNKPSINSVTLNGALTTSNLNISYRDLDDLPTIPTVTSDYSAGNTTNAVTASAVDQALTNYVPKTRTVTGTGALGGGGALSSNVTITHNAGPNGLSTAAVKVGVDSYGHACLGSAITAEDVGAVGSSYQVLNSATNINLTNLTTAVILSTQSETLSFQGTPKFGYPYKIYYVNGSDSLINLTIPYNFVDALYVNNIKQTSNKVIAIATNTCETLEFTIFQQGNQTIAFLTV